MRDRPNYLFQGHSVFDLINTLVMRSSAALKAMQEGVVLGRSTDDLVAEIGNSHTPVVPELQDEDTWIEENEITREVQRQGYDFYEDRFGGTQTVTSHVVSFHVPFTGDSTLFNVQPSQSTMPGPVADVKGRELVIAVATDRKTQEQVKAEYDGQIREIKKHLLTMANDLRSLAGQIEPPARSYIEQRKSQLLQSKSLVASLGFPMKRRPDAPATYRAPEVRRNITPARPQTVTSFKPEPALDEAEYQHILKVMDNMTKVMERSPHTFVNMGEEDIRQQFLVQLNGQYEGQATGETFNHQGKTDILIRSDGRNIFIAECKFWHGEKGFLETVDQLLSYLTWRDSKTALVIFNRNKNLSGVLEAIKHGMEKHSHKKRGPKIEGETRFRYVMGSPGDASREIIATVMVYDIPQPQ